MFVFHKNKDKLKLEKKVGRFFLTGTYMIILIPVAILIYQFIQGVFNTFSIFSVLVGELVALITFLPLIKYSKKQNRDPDDVYSQQLDILERPRKTGKLIKFVVGILCVGVGVFCVVSYVNPVKEGQVKTTATIVEEQYSSYSGTYHYNVHKGEKSGCKVIIEYDFNGEKYINEYSVDIPKIIENNIDIVINSETGELVETYLYMQQIMYFGIIAIVCGVMILSAIIFRINNLIFLPVVLFIVGAVIFVGYCLNISFANALLNPATAFSFFFISLGLYVYMSFVYISSQFPKNLDEIGKFVIWY